MLIIRTSFQISDEFLTHLSQMIHNEVSYLSSYGEKVDLTANSKYYDKLFVGITISQVPYLLVLNSYFFYHEPIIGEVNLLKIGFYSPSTDHPVLHKTPLTQMPFKIKKIKIFGEERISVWDEGKKIKYFHQNMHVDIGDYYFNIFLLQLESFDGRYICFWAHKHLTGLGFENNFNLKPVFQSEEKYFESSEWMAESLSLNLQDIKCHYEIDENGIQKNINHYSSFE